MSKCCSPPADIPGLRGLLMCVAYCIIFICCFYCSSCHKPDTGDKTSAAIVVQQRSANAPSIPSSGTTEDWSWKDMTREQAQVQYTYTQYDQEQGLPSGSIRSINEDTTGYLWITSEGSIARFDGYSFASLRHNPDDSSSLPRDFSWSGTFLPFGDIFFNTLHGLKQFNPATRSFLSNQHTEDSLSILYVRAAKDVKEAYWILRAPDITRMTKAGREQFSLPYTVNPVWEMLPAPDNNVMLYRVQTSDSLLYMDYSMKAVSKVMKRDRLGSPDSTKIMEVICAGNAFYLFTKASLFRFDPVVKSFLWQRDLHRSRNFEYEADRYFVFNDSLVVIRSLTGYLNLFNLRTGEENLVYVNKRIPESKLKDRIIFLGQPDHHGGFWMGTNNMGLIHYNVSTGSLTQYIHEPGNANSLPNNFVNVVMPDENGVLWVSCFGKGLVKMEPEIPLMEKAVPTIEGLHNAAAGGWTNNIRSFVETKDGYWIGTLAGLYNYSEQNHQYNYLDYLLPRTPRDNNAENVNSQILQVGSLAKDRMGNYWIGTWYGDIVVYDSKHQKLFSFDRQKELYNENPRGWIRSLYCDSRNRMWFASKYNGVSFIDGHALNVEHLSEMPVTRYSFEADDSTSISSNDVFVVNEDAAGQIWVGTDNGLCRYDEATKKWKRYTNRRGHPESIHNNDVRSLCVDTAGKLWIGTNGGGLNRYNPEQDDFTHFTAENGLPDDHIYSVLCDDNGMLWLGTNHGLCRFHPINFSCKNFTERDGVQNYEYNTGAALKLADGRLLIGGVAGYNIIDPDKIENRKAKAPEVVISSVKVFDKEIFIEHPFITLRHKENNLSFEYAALSYYRNSENRYVYKLVGVDPDWVFSDTRRFVSYPKLNPGDYTFRVKASNSDGVWNESGPQLHITILPPWWRTWWAYGFYFLLMTGIIYVMLTFFKRRVILQQQLKTEHDEARRLKELDTFKSQLFTNLTHEFRTPLTVILGMARQLMNGPWRTTSGEKEKWRVSNGLEMIEHNGRNLLQLINQLLDLSKLENKSFKLQYTQSDIVPYLRYLTDSFQSYAEDLGLTLIFSSAPTSRIMDFDPEQIKQVITNILSNAMKFTPAGGTIRVNVQQEGESLLLEIIDTGIGIAEKDLPHIMDRFYQADSSSTRTAQGTGIGLAHTQELLKVMGGRIDVESEVGKGTRVILHLPIRHEAPVMEEEIMPPPARTHLSFPRAMAEPVTDDLAERAAPSPDAQSLLQILIIEDNHDVVEYLRSCLGPVYEIRVAYNGKTGLEKALEDIPDLIISDVMMPEMDGYQVCDRIKNDERTSHIPLILLTAKADAASRLTGLRRGADAYMAKPFSPEELSLQIATLLDNRQRMAVHFSRVLRAGNLHSSLDTAVPEIIRVENAFIKKVNAVIESNYMDEDFGLPRLCEAVGMSRSQLFRKIKAVVDTSPSDMIRTYRLRKARLLLEQGGLSVSEVTYHVGFKDPSYFSKLFQEEFGVAPSTIQPV